MSRVVTKARALDAAVADLPKLPFSIAETVETLRKEVGKVPADKRPAFLIRSTLEIISELIRRSGGPDAVDPAKVGLAWAVMLEASLVVAEELELDSAWVEQLFQ